MRQSFRRLNIPEVGFQAPEKLSIRFKQFFSARKDTQVCTEEFPAGIFNRLSEGHARAWLRTQAEAQGDESQKDLISSIATGL